MFYSCRADQNDTKTPFSFFLESDAETEQEVIDLRGSLSNKSGRSLPSADWLVSNNQAWEGVFTETSSQIFQHSGKSGILCAVVSEQGSFLGLWIYLDFINSAKR